MRIENHRYTLKRKKANHSLQGKIGRYILLSFLTTTFIFISVFGYLGLKLLHGFSISISKYVGSSITDEMNSKEFLKAHKIKSLSDFSPSSYKYNEWKSNIDRDLTLKILNDIMLSATMDAALDDNTSVTPMKNKEPQGYPTTTFVEIIIKDKMIYSNLREHNFLADFEFGIRPNIRNNVHPSLTLGNPFNFIYTSYLYDENHNVIGTVKSQLNPSLIGNSLALAILLIIIAFIAALFGALIISWLSSVVIIRPISQLETKIHAISNEDFEATLNTRIYLKKPLREIESIADAANEIMKKMRAYSIHIGNQNRMLESQNAELESQNIELIESRAQIEKAKQKLQLREKSVRMLLDNAGQGFLSFGEDLYIDPEYSQECVNILGTEIKNQYFPQLFFYNDEEQKKFIERVLIKILTEKDKTKKQLYIPLLSDEVKINSKTIHIDYKVINDIDNDNEDDLMVVLTDITDKRNLENQIAQERNTLKMVVKVVVNFNDFTNILSDYYNFCRNELSEIFKRYYSLDETLATVYREIHTFKGNFSQLYMNNTVDYLHNIESNLEDIKNAEDVLRIEDFKLFIEDCCLENLVDEDLETLKGILGKEAFNKENVISIDKTQLLKIEQKMLNILSPFECNALLPELRNLRNKPLNELLNYYSDYVEKLAGNLNKMINPLVIEGEYLPVDEDLYREFIKSLVHVFRNILDHGIESPEERVEIGKAEYGNVTCEFKSIDSNFLHIVITDDGRGIDVNKIILNVLKKNFFTKDFIENLSEEEILNLIFQDGISTKDDVSYLSGRGIGLAAVKHEVDKLNGKVKIKTKPGEGTEMSFILPYTTCNHIPEISIQDILNPLMDTCIDLICQELKLSLIPEECADIEKINKLPLLQYSVFINLKGVIKGKVILSLDENLSKIITRHLNLGELTPEQELEYIEDTVAEFCNIIIGSSLKKIPYISDLISIEIPVAICSDNASFSCSTSQIWASKLAFESGTLILSFSSSDTFINEI